MQSFIEIPAPDQHGEPVRHPILHCSQVDSSHPHFLRALVSPSAPDDAVVVWIPYSHILSILEAPVVDKDQASEEPDHASENFGVTDSSGGLASAQRYH